MRSDLRLTLLGALYGFGTVLPAFAFLISKLFATSGPDAPLGFLASLYFMYLFVIFPYINPIAFFSGRLFLAYDLTWWLPSSVLAWAFIFYCIERGFVRNPLQWKRKTLWIYLLMIPICTFVYVVTFLVRFIG